MAEIRKLMTQLLLLMPKDREIVTLVVDVIDLDARFNSWVSVEGKRTLSLDEMLKIIEKYEKITKECQSVIVDFKRSRDAESLSKSLKDVRIFFEEM